jgi:eukaryotic-like serine/threonine-protein kinase
MSNADPTIVGGRYQLGELLGRGGMADVRKGVDLRLGRPVAVKRLRTDLASDATFQARFRREAQASASLNHPAIVSVYDTGEEMAPDASNVSQPYIVMEFVAGRTLRDILREGRKILPERALEMTAGVLAALDYSHRAGIIHRDIKPGNVMLTPAGEVKVMDFGIARAIADVNSTMTQTAAVVGTAQYLSPEQARGEKVDSRSDVYSAGCLLYELLTGRPPFVGDSPVSVAYQHVREHADPPSDHDMSLPPELDAIVMKALEKRVEDRYQSAAEMRNDIERYLAGHQIQAPLLTPAPAVDLQPTTITRQTAALPHEQEPEDASRRWRWWAAGIAALIVVIAGGAWALNAMFPDEPTKIEVPDVVGEKFKDAKEILTEEGFEVTEIPVESADAEPNEVVSQDPEGGSFAEDGETITLEVSTGKPVLQVPSNIIGMDKDQAAGILSAPPYNFKVKLIEENSDKPAGEVVRTEPGSGADIEEGKRIKVFFSAGPEGIPDVVGLTQEEAEQEIKDAGFVAVIQNDENSTEPAGTVTQQSPEAGTPLPQGSAITISVSTYVEPSSPSTGSTAPTSPSTGTTSP